VATTVLERGVKHPVSHVPTQDSGKSNIVKVAEDIIRNTPLATITTEKHAFSLSGIQNRASEVLRGELDRAKEKNVLGFTPGEVKSIAVIADLLSKCEDVWKDGETGGVKDKNEVKKIFFEYKEVKSLEEKNKYGKGHLDDWGKSRLIFLKKKCTDQNIRDLVDTVSSVRNKMEIRGKNPDDALAIGFAHAISKEGSTTPLAALVAVQLFVDMYKLSKPAIDDLALAATWAQVHALPLICGHEQTAIGHSGDLVLDSLKQVRIGASQSSEVTGGGSDYFGAGRIGTAFGSPGGFSGQRGTPTRDATEAKILRMIYDIAYSKDPTIVKALDNCDSMNFAFQFFSYVSVEKAWIDMRRAYLQKIKVSILDYDKTTLTLPDERLTDAAKDFLELNSTATNEQRLNAIIHALKQNWRISGTAALVAPLLIDLNNLPTKELESLRSAVKEASKKASEISYTPIRAWLLACYTALEITIDFQLKHPH